MQSPDAVDKEMKLNNYLKLSPYWQAHILVLVPYFDARSSKQTVSNTDSVSKIPSW
jgi:hypothetical protein